MNTRRSTPTPDPASERGVALLLALVVVILLSLLAITLTSSSLDEYRQSVNFESHEQALVIADSGLWMSKHGLTGGTVDAMMAAPAVMPKYAAYTDPAAGSHADRNPIHPLEARNVDFLFPPAAVGSRNVTGMLTPASGTAVGAGRYFVKLSDNLDEGGGQPNDPLVDSDGKYLLRSIGIHRGAHDEEVSRGSSLKNSISIVEGMVKKDATFELPAPITIAGPNCRPNVDGNSFEFDGYDHSGMSSQSIRGNHVDAVLDPNFGTGTLNDDLANGDGSACAQSINDELHGNQLNNLLGQPGDFGNQPSLADVTQEVRTGDNPDALNLFDPDFLMEFYQRTTDLADQTLAGGTSMSGSGTRLGTPASPEIVVGEGDLTVGGGGSGAGLLLVRGGLEISGSFEYEGLIVVLGGSLVMSGANKGVIGGIYVADVEIDQNGDAVFGEPSFTVGGNSDFYYAKDRIRMALDLLPLKLISWREITPEIEP